MTFPHAVQQTVSSRRQHAAVVATIPRPSAFAALSDCTSHRRRKPIFAIVHASGLKRSVGQLFCGQDENLGSRLYVSLVARREGDDRSIWRDDDCLLAVLVFDHQSRAIKRSDNLLDTAVRHGALL